jgi:hypothetical protein
VLELLGEGLSHREIAARLSVATATVKTHIDHLCQKLGVSGSARSRGLAAQATRRGLVSASPRWGTLLQMRDAEQASRPGLPALYPPESGWSATPPDVTMGEQPSA